MESHNNELFAGRYRLEQRLGNGGFGEVWRALDTVTGDEVAVKIHLKENDERAAKEIVKEYTRVRDIHHDNLLTPTHVGIADGNTPYLVMELCKGDLTDTDLEEPDVWRLLRDVAAGLARLASNQRTKRRPDGTEVLVADPIIHQDIKPANILLRSNGMYAISDFGISKRRLSSLSTNDIAETMDSAMSVDYAAPERFPRGKGVAVLASDIWSLGAMLYEIVEGHRPFAEGGGDCLNPAIGLSVPTITREGYSDELKQVIYDCMAKVPADRPTTVQLQEYADRVIKGLPRQRPWAKKPQIFQEDTPPPNRKWLFIGLATVVTVVLAVVLWPRHGGEEQWVDTMSIDMETIMDSVAVVEESPSAAVPAPQETYPVAANGGTLTLTSNPMGAVVKLDGKHKGETPLTVDELSVGNHTVTFCKEGYESTTKTVRVTAGKKTECSATLKKKASQQTSTGTTSSTPSTQKKVRMDGNTIVCTVDGAEYRYKMVYVSGGSYTMGCTSEQGGDCYSSEKPAHSVSVSGFYMGQTEVTQALWKAVMGNNPSNWKGNTLPVENVSYYDCKDFISKLNSLTGKTFRLPTEEEWEFAARGGNNSRGYKYSGSDNLGSVAWYDGNSGSKTHPVGQKQANELGLYDMSGNVWEWCSSLWCSDYNSARSGSYRVYRGGGWINRARYCRVSYRGSCDPSLRFSNLGFRLVLVP